MQAGLPHPEKIRRTIVRAFYKEGFTYEEIAGFLDIGVASVSRILRLHRETGKVDPRPRGPGRSSPIGGKVAEQLRRLVAQRPDATTAELLVALVERTGVRTSLSAVKRAMHRLGFSRKKRNSWRPNARRPKTGSVAG
jgi:transposase